MALNSGLFKGQDQNEADLGAGGWTIDQQTPSFFDNVVGSPFRGIAQVAANGIALLTHGVEQPFHAAQAFGEITNSARAFGAVPINDEPWKTAPTAPDVAEANVRQFAKSMTPDPRVTGTAANLVQGAARSVTEFTAGTLAAGPEAGAALLGTSEGYAHYNDLIDQGVDEKTAERSALLTGALNAGGAFLPLKLPARWVGGLSTGGTYLAQAGAGAAINTSFGLGQRYASAKILEDAGYTELAKQEGLWDSTNIAADAISGLFFGAHAAWHGLKVQDVDPSLRDAAKVAQDRATAAGSAPGVPVDMKSAAVHRQSLETALGDLLNDKPVDIHPEDVEGAKFARPEEDQSETAAIIREAFEKSGVLKDHEEFDRWLAGEGPKPGEEPRPESQPAAEKPESVKTESEGEGGGYDVGEGELTDEQRQQFEGLRSHVSGDEDLRGSGEGKSGQPGHSADGGARGAAVEGEPLTVYRGAKRELTHADFDESALGFSTGHPTSGLGVYFTNEAADAARYGKVTAHHLDIKNPLHLPIEEMPQFNSVQEATAFRNELRAKGYDGLTLDASHLGGPVQHVAFEHSQVYKAGDKRGTTPLAQRPDMTIANEHGKPVSAAAELAKAAGESEQAEREADPMFQAAVTCEARHQ